MKRFLFLTLLVLAGGPLSVGATGDSWINSVTVTTPPQVDHTNFINNAGGVINIATALPFDTSNTRNFTNRGTMSGSIGWRFDYVQTSTGIRRAAANFHNHPSATLTAVDGLDLSSKLLISATNLINEGVFTVGSLGLMSLNGTNVNVSRSGLQVLPLLGQGTLEDVDSTIFIPDIGIYDNYWGVGTNTFFSAPVVTLVGTNAQGISPTHRVTDPFGNFNTAMFANPAQSFVFTNADVPIPITITNSTGGLTNIFLSTNQTVQVVLVSTTDTNIGTRVRFTPSEIPTNFFSTVTVELSTTISNPVTTLEDTLTLYVLDRLASTTNFGLTDNLNAYPYTARPSPYMVSRTSPFEFLFGTGPNTLLRSNTVYDPLTMTNRVTARYAGYSATADLLTQRQPVVNDASITNIPGRIEINAGTLDMNKTRVRSDGLVTIKAKHLISSTNAIMDTFNLSMDLNSTNGNLRVQNLAKTQVKRFGGDLTMWSGHWPNPVRFVITNNFAPDPNNTNVYIPSPFTNIINLEIHVLLLNADAVFTDVPVTTHNFITRATNSVTLADPLSISGQFYTDALRFTLEGTNGFITLNGVQNWNNANTPKLKFFTNAGNIFVPNEAHFGDDVLTPYTAFVNKSNLFSTGLFIRSEYFENAGLLDSLSILSVKTTIGRMENGSSSTGGDLDVKAFQFKLRNYTNQTLGSLNFTITNTLFDNGGTANNRFSCNDGFHFNFANGTGKPTSGDLLGTTLATAAPAFAIIDHTWPGDDRGVSVAGFTNNLALGRLVLSLGFDSEVIFNGAGTSNAIYVDYLEFAGISLAQVEASLHAAPNMVIYFADSNLPAEQLDGLLGGRLRWVKSFAGPNSSVDLLVSGQVIKVNRALRQSLILDSDGDGLANGFDASPFDPAVLNLTVASAVPLTLSLNWTAAAKTIYKLEYTTNQTQGWQLLKNYTNNAAAAVPVSVLDQAPVGSPQRYYRVGYQP